MIHHLDNETLRTFSLMAEVGKVASVAEQLYITQSAVSMRLKRLEEQLDQKLFKRQGRQLVLTRSGHKLVPYVQKMLKFHDEAWHAMTGPDHQGSIRIGVPPDVIMPHIPTVLIQIRKRWPALQPVLDVDNTIPLLQKTAKGQLDIALGTLDYIPQNAEVLSSSPLVWAADKDGAAFEREPLLFVRHEQCAFETPALQALEQSKRSWEVWADIHSDVAKHALLTTGICFSTEMRSYVPDNLGGFSGQEINLPTLPIFHTVMLTPTTTIPYVQDVAELIRETFRATQPVDSAA